MGVFSDFDELGIRTFRIDLSKPLSEQEHVDAVFHKIMLEWMLALMPRDQYSSLTEEDARIISWMKETRAAHPHLLWIDDMENLDAFLERTYSYEVAQQAINASHLESVLHVPEYFLLPKGTSVLGSLEDHRSCDRRAFQ